MSYPFRDEDGTIKTRAEIEVYLDGTIEEAIAEIREAAKGLTNARFEVHGWVDRDRDQDGGTIEVIGDRPPTDGEVALLEAREARERQQEADSQARKEESRRQADERALARAREAFPDLFKSTS